MKKRLIRNWRAKLMAFILALMLWGFLKEAQSPGTLDLIWAWLTQPAVASK